MHLILNLIVAFHAYEFNDDSVVGFNEKNSNIIYCFDCPIFKHQTQNPYYCFIIYGVFFHPKTISNDWIFDERIRKKMAEFV